MQAPPPFAVERTCVWRRWYLTHAYVYENVCQLFAIVSPPKRSVTFRVMKCSFVICHLGHFGPFLLKVRARTHSPRLSWAKLSRISYFTFLLIGGPCQTGLRLPEINYGGQNSRGGVFHSVSRDFHNSSPSFSSFVFDRSVFFLFSHGVGREVDRKMNYGPVQMQLKTKTKNCHLI